MDRIAKNAQISALIIKNTAEYMRATGAERDAAIVWAIDRVLGAGTYAALVEDLYHSLRAKAAA